MGKLNRMNYGKNSDPFLQQRLQKEEKEKDVGQCTLTWTKSRADHPLDDIHTEHRCRRIKDHKANHRCSCGAGRKI